MMDEHKFDEWEQELTEALTRRPAPPGLKQRIFAERARRAEAERFNRSRLWMRVAASIALAAAVSGAGLWQWHREEADRQRGEEARQQVMTALGITARTLDKVQQRLAAHNENQQ